MEREPSSVLSFGTILSLKIIVIVLVNKNNFKGEELIVCNVVFSYLQSDKVNCKDITPDELTPSGLTITCALAKTNCFPTSMNLTPYSKRDLITANNDNYSNNYNYTALLLTYKLQPMSSVTETLSTPRHHTTPDTSVVL